MGYLTPDAPPPNSFVCRRIIIPNSQDWLALVAGALASLVFLDSWEEFGSMTREEAAQTAKRIFLSFGDGGQCMIGAIIPYATAALPPNVLPCDGSVYQRTDYPILYDLLDPSLHINADEFATPDLRGRVVVGAGVGVGLTPRPNLSTGGEEEVTLSISQIPPHSHLYTPPALLGLDLEDVGVPTPAASIGTPTQTSAEGGGLPHNNMPPYLAVRYGIIAK